MHSTNRSLGSLDSRLVVQPVSMTASYKIIREELLKCLDAHTTVYFMLEAVVEKVPAVVVLLRKEDAAREHIQKELNQIAETIGYQVYTFGGTVGLYTRVVCARIPQNPHLQELVESGASIGVDGEQWSGTFGGYLRDKVTGEVFGHTCGHNICRYDVDDSRSPEELTELLPTGTSMVQPSAPDGDFRLANLAELSAVAQKIVDACIRRDGPSAPPSYRRANAESTLLMYQQETNQLTSEDLTFGWVTDMKMLRLYEGRLVDYALISMNPHRQGAGHMDGKFAQHPKQVLSAYEDVELRIIGRTSGRSSGTIKGYLGDARVERFPSRFSCIYAHSKGGNMTTLGDSGAWGAVDDEAVGYVFGGGVTEEVQLEVSWLICMTELIKDIERDYGRQLEIWTME